MKKYRLSDETRLWQWKNGETTHAATLRQIIATADFNDVTVGTRGGWIDDERALAQDGDCWIYDENSVVFAGATVSGNARLTLPCIISHDAHIGGSCWLDGAEVSHGATSPYSNPAYGASAISTATRACCITAWSLPPKG